MVKIKMSIPRQTRCRTSGLVLLEIVVALGIVSAAMLPLAFSFIQEQRLARAYYFRAVALEIIDGEMEVLAAGEWQSYPEGTRPYSVRAGAAASLPAGQFVLTRAPLSHPKGEGKAKGDQTQLRLEWRPGKRGQGGPVSREIALRNGSAADSGQP